MQSKRIICAWAIFALVFAQLAIAQHNAVHAYHSLEKLHVESHVDEDYQHDDENKPRSHECPEYLLVKILQVAFYSDVTSAILLTGDANLYIPAEKPFVSDVAASPYQSRAPPVHLI